MSHNPLAISDDTPPDFVNGDDVKWWRLDSRYAEECGVPFRVELANGEPEYVILLNDTVAYSTHSLESLYGKLQQNELIMHFKEDNQV